MSQNPAVHVKSESGVVGGSLTLLTSYGGSDSDSDGDGERRNPDHHQRAQNPMKLEHAQSQFDPNLRIKKEKEEEEVVLQENANPGASGGTVILDPSVTVKMEDSEVQELASSHVHTDFASIRGNNVEMGEEFQLGVEDFTGGESYTEVRNIKQEVESGTSDSESDSEPTNSSESESDDGERIPGENDGAKKRDNLKVKGELRLCDLPPIEDLHISVPHEDCKPIGVIKSVVEPLVIVEAYLNTPALNLDSVLFLEEGDRALGHIFDVIGPVKQPMYCVRFNSKEHIDKNKIEVGMQVYCAPKTPYTSFVFLAQLRKLKGSDASWVNDIEPPADEVEYSDDEMERFAKKKKRNRKFGKTQATEEDAMYKEDAEESGQDNRFRGRKRNYDQKGQHVAPSFGQYSPFVAPMVPGFVPYGIRDPSFCSQPPGFSHPPRMPMPRQRFHRAFRPIRNRMEHGYGSYEVFRAPPPQPYQFRPWCPPNHMQNQPPTNYNFGGHFPGPQTFRPPPPPPPPPPN